MDKDEKPSLVLSKTRLRLLPKRRLHPAQIESTASGIRHCQNWRGNTTNTRQMTWKQAWPIGEIYSNRTKFYNWKSPMIVPSVEVTTTRLGNIFRLIHVNDDWVWHFLSNDPLVIFQDILISFSSVTSIRAVVAIGAKRHCYGHESCAF